MSSTPLNVGLLGCGPVTQAIHLPVLAAAPNLFQVSRVMDVNPDVANAVASRCGAVATGNAEEIFGDPMVDVIAICSPNSFHAKQVVAACKAGKRAVLCEKPLAVSREEAHAIKVEAEASGTAVFVNTMHAYDPAYRAGLEAWRLKGEAATHVRSGIFLPSNDEFIHQATEQVPVVAAQHGHATLDVAFKKAMMRGGMLGLAIHNVPLVRDFQPRMGRLLAAEFMAPFGYALMTESDGCCSELTALMPGEWPAKWTFEVTGAHHWFRATMPPSYVMAGSARVEIQGRTSSQVFQFDHNGYQAVWQAIAHTLRDGAPPPIPLDTAIADLAFALDLADGIDQLLDAA